MPSLVGLLSVDLGNDLGFGDAGLGAAVSAFWLVTAIAAPLAGRWVDARGWPVGACVGALLTAAGLATCALLVHSWLGLLVVLAVSGIGYAFCSPTSNILVVAVVPPRRQASILGFKQTAPPLLMATAGATLPALAHAHGWRWAVALGLLLPVGVLVGVRRLLATGVPVRSARPSAGVAAPVPDGLPTPEPAAPLRALPVVVAAGLGTLSVATVTGFAVFTLVSVDVAPVRAAAVVAVGSLAAVLARVAAGRFLDSRPVEDLAPVLVVMGLAALALAMVATGTFGSAGGDGVWRALVVAGVALSLVTAWTWPALLLLMVVRRARGPGAASGLLQLGSGIGSAVGPVGFGLLSGAGSRGWAWLVMTAATALAMVLVARAGRPVRAVVAAEG